MGHASKDSKRFLATALGLLETACAFAGGLLSGLRGVEAADMHRFAPSRTQRNGAAVGEAIRPQWVQGWARSARKLSE